METLITDEFDDLEGSLQPLHQRSYVVRSYKRDDTHLHIRGVVRDQKPAGMYIPGDPEPLTVHFMVVDIIVEFPSLVITEARLAMRTHPHAECTSIEGHYAKLVGLSIARGFTHKVRELFGGPRGCTHTTALLQAMAPVAVQSMWSMRVAASEASVGFPSRMTPEQRRQNMEFNRNTCHVWAEDGPMYSNLVHGELPPPPMWGEQRLRALGRDPHEWFERMGD